MRTANTMEEKLVKIIWWMAALRITRRTRLPAHLPKNASCVKSKVGVRNL